MRPTSFRFLGFAFLFVALIFCPSLVSADSPTTGKSPDIPVRLIKQENRGNESTIITIDLGRPDVHHSSLTLTTSDRNFRREVQIESSVNGRTWVKFEGQRFIFDHQPEPGKTAVKNTTIGYPEVTDRYLRVTIYDRGERPLIIAGALAHRAVALVATSTSQYISSTTPPRAPFYEHPIYLLVGVVALTVLIIGCFTFRLFRQTQV